MDIIYPDMFRTGSSYVIKCRLHHMGYQSLCIVLFVAFFYENMWSAFTVMHTVILFSSIPVLCVKPATCMQQCNSSWWYAPDSAKLLFFCETNYPLRFWLKLFAMVSQIGRWLDSSSGNNFKPRLIDHSGYFWFLHKLWPPVLDNLIIYIL